MSVLWPHEQAFTTLEEHLTRKMIGAKFLYDKTIVFWHLSVETVMMEQKIVGCQKP